MVIKNVCLYASFCYFQFYFDTLIKMSLSINTYNIAFSQFVLVRSVCKMFIITMKLLLLNLTILSGIIDAV